MPTTQSTGFTTVRLKLTFAFTGSIGCGCRGSEVLTSSLLMSPIHLLRVANDLAIAGPRSRAHDAINANRPPGRITKFSSD